MRHYSVAHATAWCRKTLFDGFSKIDYEGKTWEKLRFPKEKSSKSPCGNLKNANNFAKFAFWKEGSREPGPL